MELLDDALFEKILSIKSVSKRALKEEELFAEAKKQKKLQLVKNAYKEYKKERAIQKNKMIFEENVELNVPGYSINENGQIVDFNNNLVTATLIYPLNIYVNLQTGEEIVECKYKIGNIWKVDTWSKDVLLTTSKIIELSKKGIDVSSESSKLLIAYFRQVFNNNSFERKKSTQKFGWEGNSFIPYDEEVKFDGDIKFQTFSQSYHTKGSYDIWLKEMYKVRNFNKVIKIAMGTSFVAPVLKLLNRDSFITIIWGETGCGKSVSARITQSIWGRNIISEDIATCKNTPFVLAQFADMYNNLPVIFDELQLYDEDLNQLIMMLCENSEKGRGTASGGIRRICNWRTSFTITGEESGVKPNTSGGALNRLIEIYCDKDIVEDKIGTCDILNENYGFGGKKYIDYIKSLPVEKIREKFNEKLESIKKINKTAEKQAISMALIMLGDQLACECIFTKDTPLRVEDIEQYLRDKSEIDNTQNAYKVFIDQVSSNRNKFGNFETRKEGITSRVEHFGFIDEKNNRVFVVSNKLKDLLNNEFDVKKCLNKWSKLGLVNKNKNTGKFIKQIRAGGVVSNYYEIVLPDKDDEELEKEAKKENVQKEKTKYAIDYINEYKKENYTVDDMYMKVGE